MVPDTDVLIVGGGPVGAALALALQRHSDSALRVTVLEARAAAVGDSRPIALSHGSRLLLERLDAWNALQPTPIAHIHVSQQGRFGRVALAAREANVPALGYVVDYSAVFAALTSVLRQVRRAMPCDYRVGARAIALHDSEDGVCVDYEHGEAAKTLSARLLVIADGGDIVGLAPQQVTDYRQCALTACVRTEVAHGNIAYERFTRGGPLALLPFGEELALVWTLTPEQAQAMQVADDATFLAALRSAFGGRLGNFTAVRDRAVYPLALRRGVASGHERVVAIGNAAQTLHPVAGQGFNLGLRDAWELAQALWTVAPAQLGAPDTLRGFHAARRLDRQATVSVTHGLVQLFSNDYFALGALRGAGMMLLGSVPPLRDFLARRMIFGARG